MNFVLQVVSLSPVLQACQTCLAALKGLRATPRAVALQAKEPKLTCWVGDLAPRPKMPLIS